MKQEPKCFLVLVLLYLPLFIGAQRPGLIYRPSESAFGQRILDPNGDGFVSSTSRGFVSKHDFGNGSELRLIPLPSLEAEPHSDLTTGSNGGHTDLTSSDSIPLQSSYVGISEVAGVKYFLVRIRIGGASTATKGYSVLIDTDGQFSVGLLGSNNPGYDKEVALETGNSGRVAVYTHTLSGSTLDHSFPVGIHHQRSIAATNTNGNPDYFYDFFVPLSSLGISTSQMIRLTAATITSAQSGITGTISDFNGVDDKKYNNNRTALMMALVTTFPAASLAQMENPNFSFGLPKSIAPVIQATITPGQTTLNGTSNEANGTVINVFRNGVSIGTATVNGGTWSLSVSAMTAGQTFTATATAPNKSVSDLSMEVVVPAAVQDCFTPAPAGLTRATQGSNRSITGTWSGDVTPNGSNVRIQLFRQTAENTITVFNSGTAQGRGFVQANGSWSIITGLGSTDFNNSNFLARATVVSNSCESGFSAVNVRTSGNTNTIGVVTAAPTIVTTPVYASGPAQNIVVRNNATYAATLILYINEVEYARTLTTIAANTTHTFSVPGLFENDRISARAQGTGTSPSYWLSNVSNIVTVQLLTPPATLAPEIQGKYFATGVQTVTGTSIEPAGTVITLFVNGNQVGTTTVNGFNSWSISGVNLSVVGQVLTAFAKAEGKSMSPVSESTTVKGNRPSPPNVTGPNYFFTATSISGTNGAGLVTVYLDGEPIGTTTPTSGAWALSGIPSRTLYKGGQITATNTVNGVESNTSNHVQVMGISGFKIREKKPDGVADTSMPSGYFSGDVIFLEVFAKRGNGPNGPLETQYNGAPQLTAEVPILKWEGRGQSAQGGRIGSGSTSYQFSVGGHGPAKRIYVVDPDDPTAYGETFIDVDLPYWRGQPIPLNGDERRNRVSSNWLHNRVPLPGANIAFDPTNTYQDLTLDSSYQWGEVDFNGTGFDVVLGNYDVEITSVANRSNTGANPHGRPSMFRTNGAGRLKMKVNTADTITMHVGNSVYNPLTIINQGYTDTFYVQVIDSMFANGYNGAAFPAGHVGRTWEISKATPANTDGVQLGFQFNANQVQGSINTFTMYHYNGSGWDAVSQSTPIVAPGTVPADNEFLITFPLYTGSFSPFGVGDVQPLPVDLTKFTGLCNEASSELSWETASEIRSQWFYLEQSHDLIEWHMVERLPAAGNSNVLQQYQWKGNARGPYFRLVQADFDGSREVFPSIYLACEGSTAGLLVFPNPAREQFNVFGLDPNTMVHVYDLNGKKVWSGQSDLAGGSITSTANFPGGIYVIQGQKDGFPITHRIVVNP